MTPHEIDDTLTGGDEHVNSLLKVLFTELDVLLIHDILTRVVTEPNYRELIDPLGSPEFSEATRRLVKSKISSRLEARASAAIERVSNYAVHAWTALTGGSFPQETPLKDDFDCFRGLFGILPQHDADVLATLGSAVVGITGGQLPDAAYFGIPKTRVQKEASAADNSLESKQLLEEKAREFSRQIGGESAIAADAGRLGVNVSELLTSSVYYHYFIRYPTESKPVPLAKFERLNKRVKLHRATLYTYPFVLTHTGVYTPQESGILALGFRAKPWDDICRKVMRTCLYTMVADEYKSRNRHMDRPESHELMSEEYRDELLDILNFRGVDDDTVALKVLDTIYKLPLLSSSDAWGIRMVFQTQEQMLELYRQISNNYRANHGKMENSASLPSGDGAPGKKSTDRTEQMETARLLRQYGKKTKLLKEDPFAGTYAIRVKPDSTLQDEKYSHLKVALAIPATDDLPYPFEVQLTQPLPALWANYFSSDTNHAGYRKRRESEEKLLQKEVDFYDPAYRMMRSVCPP